MSFPRYPKYKPSGVEWLGDVPEGWEVTLTKRFITVRSGEMISADEETTDGFPLIGGNGIRAHTRKWNTPADTLVIGRVGAHCGCVHHIKDNFWASEHAFRVIEKRRFEKRFFFHLLSALRLNNFAITTAQPLLNTQIVESQWISVPPLPEQTAIAAFLDRETAKIDGLVAEQKRLMELLKEKREAVISHAVTKGLDPNAKMKPSGVEWLGEVPEGWNVVALKRIASVHTGVAKGKDLAGQTTLTVPYLRVANVQDGYLDLDEVALIEILPDELDRYRLQPGDVLMNEGGDFDKLGRGHVWDGQIDPCITQNHVFAVRPKSVASHWLNTITSSDFAQFYFMSRSKQSTNLASISSTNLMELPVVLPPTDEQAAIIKSVSVSTAKLDTLTAEAQRAIDLLQERRTALISAAVTGQIDVRNINTKEGV